MKSYKSLETAAIFYSSEPFLKQGISLVYVMVDFIHMQWYEPRDVRVKVKSSKGNPGSTDLISDRLCDMV